MAERKLTSGEITLAQTIFGNSINYEIVNVISSNLTSIKQGGAMSFGGDIMYLESKHYSDDFSNASNIQKVLFIHEMVHVWQSQSGRNVFAEGFALQVKSLFSDDIYVYGSVTPSTKFEDLGLEQQAALVEDMFRQQLGFSPREGNAPADPKLIKSLLPFSPTSGSLPPNNKVLVPLPPPRPTEFGGIAQCFLAGTPIALPGGKTVAIEDIKPGQDVLAFDTATNGMASPLVARKVVRLFENITQQIVDFHGLKCTPGHVFLSVDPNCDDHIRFATIASVLKEDGIVVRQDGVKIRARTNQQIGTIEDVVVRIVCRDPTDQTENYVYARAGIPTACEIRDEVSGQSKTTMIPLSQLIACLGYRLGADGLLESPDGERFDAIDWPAHSTPYDVAEAQNWIVADHNGQFIRPHWIDALPDRDQKPNLVRRATA